jgi:hypothetical protein
MASRDVTESDSKSRKRKVSHALTSAVTEVVNRIHVLLVLLQYEVPCHIRSFQNSPKSKYLPRTGKPGSGSTETELKSLKIKEEMLRDLPTPRASLRSEIL